MMIMFSVFKTVFHILCERKVDKMDDLIFMLGSIEFCNMEPIRTVLQDMGIWEEGCFFLNPDEELVNEINSRLLTL